MHQERSDGKLEMIRTKIHFLNFHIFYNVTYYSNNWKKITLTMKFHNKITRDATILQVQKRLNGGGMCL